MRGFRLADLAAGLALLAGLASPGWAAAVRPQAEAVLIADTVWSGEILVTGVVVVAKGATLRLLPGTRVQFQPQDRNHDGIGDGEIRVLGRILAEGTPEAPVVFQSAAAAPAARDWSYVLLFAASGESLFRFCRFHHAFSGLQVHFATARVADCLFAGNQEGLRFGRAYLLVEHSDFVDNDLGIRFTRMEGPVGLLNNRISGNRIGIFLAPSGQNITDFFEPDRSGVPWNTGRLAIRGNLLAGNGWYNLSLGEKQMWDLEAAGNWWGSPEAGAIEATLFDGRRDPGLGRVLFQPALAAPPAAAGRRGPGGRP
ncbi:MAG: hypothetical protein AB1634_13370, partial [Thermodesulfobacteriota bacterium]